MASVHDVKPGDCFNSIAKQYGFYNYLTLYGHGDNASIKGIRKNPNMLIEGDPVVIPDKRQKKMPLTLDAEKKFVVDRQKTKLRLALKDVENKGLLVEEIQLKVGALTSTAKPNGDGLIEVEIDPSVKTGMLQIKPFLLKKPVPPKKPVLGAEPEHPPHPPKIKADDFTDEPPKNEPPEFLISLHLGYLEPHDETRGALQRLNNLGCKFPKEPGHEASDDETKRVLKSYQKFKGEKDPSGSIDDIKGSLEGSHDKV